jgi:hypothetical protein
MPSFEQIEDAVEHVHPIPQVALRIIRMIHGDNYCMKDITEDRHQARNSTPCLIPFFPTLLSQ